MATPAHFILGPKAHAEEVETSEDESRKLKFPRNITEDYPVLG